MSTLAFTSSAYNSVHFEWKKTVACIFYFILFFSLKMNEILRGTDERQCAHSLSCWVVLPYSAKPREAEGLLLV